MITSELKNPDFLFCELPKKNGDIVHDNRGFIYCPKYLSLIEIVPVDLYLALFPSTQTQKEYDYHGETFLLVFTQNNVEMCNDALEIEILKGEHQKVTDLELMDKAWDFYKEYLTWEDSQF